MSTAAEVFDSSRERPLGLRYRKDLVIVEQVYRDEPFWLIKDPLEMEFYRLNEEEHFVLKLVDGKLSLEEIKSAFEKKYPSQRITHKELQNYISDLHNKCLLAYTDPAVGAQLIDRAKEKRWKKTLQNLSNILSVKWRGVDPDRFLSWLTPKIGWMFSLPAVICSLLLMAAAGLWLLTHWSIFVARLPGLGEFLQQRNWLLLACVIVVLKIVHEFGHGISFKRFGGECHEIGVMWMLFIPTLYCNTTDSWLLASKWKRAAIGAAGMYVELLIAALATFAWWFSEPGTFNLICLNIMATGSLSVLLINANPFLKYDGYYILSDLAELPNLRERAAKMTQNWFLKFALGVEEQEEINSRLDTKVSLVLYTVVSFVFRAALVSTILILMVQRLQPIGLGYVGLTLGIMGIASLLVPVLWIQYQFFKIPGRLHRIEMKRLLPTTALIAGLILVVFCLPLPHHVTCSFTIKPLGGQAMYVKHDAILKAIHVLPGQRVTKGELVAELENVETLLKLSKFKAEGDEIRSELRLLEQNRKATTEETKRINELRESLRTNEESRRNYEEIVESFRMVAPQDGQIIPEWSKRRRETGLELGSWDGSPLAAENLGTSFSSGEKICTIGDLNRWEAVMLVNEHDIRFLKEGQPVKLLTDSQANHRIASQVESIARKESEQVPGSLSKQYGGSIQLQTQTKTEEGNSRPADEHFEVRAVLPDSEFELSSGLRGTAQIRVGSKTMYARSMLYFYRIFQKAL
jgi:putative peptide zinc metalloprotease protein